MISVSNFAQIARRCVLLLLALTATLENKAANLTATSMVSSKSFYLGESTSTAGYKIYFNSYDGITTYSRSQTVHCGEVLNFNNGAYNYVSDYDIYGIGYTPYDGPYNPIGYGTISFAIPTTDSDGDGLIDFLDRSIAFNSTITGTITEYVTSKGIRSYSTSCLFKRGANSETAEFAFTTSAAKITGFAHLYTGTATVTYDPDAKTIKFTGIGFGFGNPYNPGDYGIATSTYEVLSPTSIRVNAFTYSNYYTTKSVNSFIMTRNGNKFTAAGSMQDGDTYSSWVDYKDFVLAITDNNDTDSDGIPDLADDLIYTGPVITQEPQGKNVVQGSNTSLSVTATSPFTMTYQWYLNEAPLDGKTDSTLSFTSTQTAAAGNYRVVITSNGKTKTSQTVALGVYVPPNVTLSPLATTLVAGKTLTLTAGATGTPAPTYEWYRDNNLLQGFNDAMLTINNIGLNQGGSYYAKAINAGGTANTTSAKVIVTTGIFTKPGNISKESLQSTGFPLDFQLENGKTYRIEYSTDLVTWNTLTTFTSNSTAKQFLDTAAAANEQRFYRLVAQ
jgi:hypothetical protein